MDISFTPIDNVRLANLCGALDANLRQIETALDVSIPTIERVRCALVTHGLEAALDRRRSATRRAHKLDGSQEAHLVALVCGPPPPGAARWTLTLLADQLVELKIVDAIAPETVRQTLKKTNLNPG